VRTASHFGIDVLGVMELYKGLMKGEFIPLSRRSVSGIIDRGGTILKSARSDQFLSDAGQKKAVENIKDNNIQGLIVIGGNGSLHGAHVLAAQYDVPVVAVPATIDNDINGIDLTIGVDTALNVAIDALDKIRDTAMSMERIFVVEVMGRNCGYIALKVALAGGCEEVLLPEKEINLDQMYCEITEGNAKGKVSWIIVVSEGKAKAADIAKKITEKTSLETRVAVLGHIQRGGSPTALDRIMASKLGHYAVEVLKSGDSDVCVRLNDNRLDTIPLEAAIQTKKIEVDSNYNLIKILT
jgi:6-phosphofructokinase 1